MSIVEIENAIKNLPPEKVNELMEWFVKYHAEVWDDQIAEDLKAGRFDSILAEVDSDIASGAGKAAVKHVALPRFWKCYCGLPRNVQLLADRNYRTLKSDPSHPSLHFKKIGKEQHL
jgi:hypothetical protein